ncbi:FecR domain-containing protein [Bacteriovoracaceae bacterium]|nr:FecR domain-containing protein [Bacteriovoracaceae bacterium]
MLKKSRSNNKNKFFIKTRNAAMAVRGTEFQTVYNPEGNLTSLLTYKGEVAMVKMNDQENKDYEVKRDERNNVKVKQKPRKETDLKRIFKKKKSVVVKQGQFSGTVNKLDTVSLPVKINPVQLNLLYKNDGLEEKTSKRKAQIDPSDQRLAIKSFKQDAPLEGIVDKKKKIYAPKAGGFLDMSTGLYVAPSNVSKLNKKLGVYVDKDSGDINADSGEYIPPAGLKLDSEKGFVPDIKSRLKLDKKQLMAKAATLNKNSAQDVVVGEKEKVVEIKSYTPRDIFTRESLSFSFGFLEEKLFVSKDTRDSDNTFRTKESVGFGLLWTQKSFKELPLLSPFYGFSIRKIDYTHTSRRGYTQNETSLVTLKFGTKYSLNNRTNLIGIMSLDQNLFLAHTSANSGNVSSLEVVTIPKVFFGIETDLLKSNRFFLNAKFLLGMNLGKTKNDFKVDPALLFDKSIGLGYWWSKSFNTKLSGFHNTTTQKVNSDYWLIKNVV